MTDLVWTIMSLALALLMGFAIQRGGVCAVVATRQLIVHRRWHRTRAFFIAACWSMVIIVPLAWAFPGQIHLSQAHPITASVISFAVLFGVGAYINNACAFGTLAGLTSGDLNYVATVFGMVLGASILAVSGIDNGEQQRMSEPPMANATVLGFLVLTAGALAVAHAVYRHYRVSRRWVPPLRELVNARRWRAAPALAVLGVAGGLLYASAGQWTYLAILSDRAAQLVAPAADAIPVKPLLASATLLIGGVLAAYTSGRFRWQRPGLIESLQKIVGGALMSVAAALLPGGNDVLILYGMPSLAPNAIAAYFAMTLTLCLLLALFHKRQRDATERGGIRTIDG